MKEKWMNDEGKDIDGEKQRGSVNVTVFRVSQNCLRPWMNARMGNEI